MSFAAAAFVSAVAISLVVTPLARSLSLAWGAIDHPNQSRKVHNVLMPRMGGLGLVAATFMACGVAMLYPEIRAAIWGQPAVIMTLGVSALAVVALGAFDDLRGANAQTKFAVQFAAALLLYAAGFRLTTVDGLFGTMVPLGSMSLPFTVLWIVGVSNALNLVDGLDGLAGGIGLAAAIAIFAIAANVGDVLVMAVAASIAGGIAGFLPFNMYPASVFMGDTGSLFLGTVLGALSTRLLNASAAGVPTVAIVVVLAIPLVDTAAAMMRRTLRGVPLFTADREHVHHRLLALGLPQSQVVLVLWMVAALLAWAGVQIATGAISRAGAVVTAVCGFAVAVVCFGVPHVPLALLMRWRRRNRERLAAVRAAARRVLDARTVWEINASLQAVAPTIQAQAIRVRSASAADPGNGCTPRAPSGSVFPVDQGRPDLGYLEVDWVDGAARDRDAEIAVERLCRHVAVAVRRMAPVRGRPNRADALWRRAERYPGGGRAGVPFRAGLPTPAPSPEKR